MPLIQRLLCLLGHHAWDIAGVSSDGFQLVYHEVCPACRRAGRETPEDSPRGRWLATRTRRTP